MSHKEASNVLGGTTALLKAQATRTFELCAREASQVFGGLSYTRGGQGNFCVPSGLGRFFHEIFARQIFSVLFFADFFFRR